MLGLVPLVKALSWTILTIDSTVVTICTVWFHGCDNKQLQVLCLEQCYRLVLVTQAVFAVR